ncbi:MAG: hypothetical protein N2448_01290 [Caloramator sp.]|nr:hypothetical protein [Caloramator sp.]
MFKKMPFIIKFFIFLLILNVLLFGVKVTSKNSTANKYIDNIIKDVLEDNISHYKNKEKLVMIKQAFEEYEKIGFDYAHHYVSHCNGKVYNVSIVFIDKGVDFNTEKYIEIAIKLKKGFWGYKFEDASIIYLK